MAKVYLCNCFKFCKGQVRSVSRTTYKRHAAFRSTPEEELAAQFSLYSEDQRELDRIPEEYSGEGSGSDGESDRESAGEDDIQAYPAGTSGTSALDGAESSVGPGALNMDADIYEELDGNPAVSDWDEGGYRNDLDMDMDRPEADGGDADPYGMDVELDDVDAEADGNADAEDDDDDADMEPDPGSLADDDGRQETSDRSSDAPDDDGTGSNDEPGVEEAEFADIEELSDLAKLEELQTALQFISAMKDASLDDKHSKLDPHTLERMRNPPQEVLDVSDPDLRLALDLFLATSNSSQDTYTAACKAVSRRFPSTEIFSYDRIKRRVADLSGVDSIVHDMCINSCLAYTGPFSELETCPKCGELRYDPIRLAESSGKVKVPRQEFHTIPLGPQLQALWRDPESADSVRYRGKRTSEILAEMNESQQHATPFPSSYNDILDGEAYLHAVLDDKIRGTDMVVMLSLDGAQLYQNKTSDCWIYIWVVIDHAPECRYKKKYVLPGGFIPGPNKPKNVESFLFPGFHHVSALQREGLSIWDASQQKLFCSRPFVFLGTADVLGMVHISGLVGHHGKYGCRLYCSQKGRHKPGGSHYYPALLKPNNYDVEGCAHDDASFRDPDPPSPDDYRKNLEYLVSAINETQYKKRRLETGISKPSIFLGFQQECVLLVPICFGSDIMHLGALNIPDCLINLWRGNLDCDRSDNKASWDWAVLQGNVWKEHGDAVANATSYLPGSFDRPPRNPAEKISSGYKATEFNTYLYGLAPALLYGVLPDKYWQHFCKLVFGMRIVAQHHIQLQDLQHAHVVEK